MSVAVTAKDAQDLRKLIPLNILATTRFEQLCASLAVEEVPKGSILFSRGDATNEFVYVLSGTVSLQAGGMEMETITGGTDAAKFALAHQLPRKVSAVAKDRVRFVRVDASVVNQSTDSAVTDYEVSDIPEESSGGDWLKTLLKSPIFQRLPPANLQQILSRLEEIPVSAGQEIIHQDEPGDYYYVIKKGRCVLTRRPSRLAREVKLAELKTCDTFGEDSLLSDQPRNVTVTMMTDGALLRLSKAHFLKFVKEPVLTYVDPETSKKLLMGGARWLDVRSQDAYEEGHFPSAINIPFFRLRVELNTLDRQHPYILVCETGRISEAAAFLLLRNHFEAFVLQGGIGGVLREQLVKGGEEPDLRLAPADASIESAVEVEDKALTLQPMSMPSEQRSGFLDTDSSILSEPVEVARLRGENEELREELMRLRTAYDASTVAAVDEPEPVFDEASAPVAPVIAGNGLVGYVGSDSEMIHDDRVIGDDLHPHKQRADVLESENSRLLTQYEQATTQIRALEAQVEGLRTLVQEFVNREAQNGESEELLALRSELETIRAQAAADVQAMRNRTLGAEQEVQRLRTELDATHQQLLSATVEREASAMLKNGGKQGGAAPDKPSSPIVLAFLMLLVGAGLVLGLALGTPQGRTLMLQWLNPPHATESDPVSPPNPPTPTPPPAEPAASPSASPTDPSILPGH